MAPCNLALTSSHAFGPPHPHPGYSPKDVEGNGDELVVGHGTASPMFLHLGHFGLSDSMSQFPDPPSRYASVRGEMRVNLNAVEIPAG